MRLELTLVSCINDVRLVRLVYAGARFPSFPKCVYSCLLYLSLIFDMFIVVCICVCIEFGVVLAFTYIFFFVCVSVYLGEICGFKYSGSSFFFFLYMYT